MRRELRQHCRSGDSSRASESVTSSSRPRILEEEAHRGRASSRSGRGRGDLVRCRHARTTHARPVVDEAQHGALYHVAGARKSGAAPPLSGRARRLLRA